MSVGFISVIGMKRTSHSRNDGEHGPDRCNSFNIKGRKEGQEIGTEIKEHETLENGQQPNGTTERISQLHSCKSAQKDFAARSSLS
jgi:hypothetical protein